MSTETSKLSDPRLSLPIPLRDFTMAMHSSIHVRAIIQKTYPLLWKKFTYYSTTYSNYCPRVYLICETIIKAIIDDGTERHYKKILERI